MSKKGDSHHVTDLPRFYWLRSDIEREGMRKRMSQKMRVSIANGHLTVAPSGRLLNDLSLFSSTTLQRNLLQG